MQDGDKTAFHGPCRPGSWEKALCVQRKAAELAAKKPRSAQGHLLAWQHGPSPNLSGSSSTREAPKHPSVPVVICGSKKTGPHFGNSANSREIEGPKKTLQGGCKLYAKPGDTVVCSRPPHKGNVAIKWGVRMSRFPSPHRSCAYTQKLCLHNPIVCLKCAIAVCPIYTHIPSLKITLLKKWCQQTCSTQGCHKPPICEKQSICKAQ